MADVPSSSLKWFIVLVLLNSFHCLSASSSCKQLLANLPNDGTNYTVIRVIFINGSLGKDTDSCGTQQQPCRTISHSVLVAFLSNNISSVKFSISEGIYRELDPVKVDCTYSKVAHLAFYGEGKSSNTQTDMSIEAVKCSVAFINIHWKQNIRPIMMNILFTNFSLCDCTVEHSRFSMIGLASNVELHRTKFFSCRGWQPSLPLFSLGSLQNYPGMVHISSSNFSCNNVQVLGMNSLSSAVVTDSHFVNNSIHSSEECILTVNSGMLSIHGSNFQRNKGSVLYLTNGSTANISDSLFYANVVQTGSVVTLEKNSHLSVLDSAFEDNYGMAKGSVASVQGEGDTVTVRSCYFGCNSVNGSVHASPVTTSGNNKATCYNCTVDPECPVFCGGGKYLSGGVLCYVCPKGTYTQDTDYNITTLSCTKCPAGSYNPSEGKQECIPCDAGYYSSRTGSTSCEQCKNDFFTSYRGQSSCSKMTIGFIILTSVVFLLIALPLAILLARRCSKGTTGKLCRLSCCYPDRHLVDTAGWEPVLNGDTSNQVSD